MDEELRGQGQPKVTGEGVGFKVGHGGGAGFPDSKEGHDGELE